MMRGWWKWGLPPAPPPQYLGPFGIANSKVFPNQIDSLEASPSPSFQVGHMKNQSLLMGPLKCPFYAEEKHCRKIHLNLPPQPGHPVTPKPQLLSTMATDVL